MSKIIVSIYLLLFFSVTISGQTENRKQDIPGDSVLKSTLEIIKVKDQALRMLLPDAEEKFGKDSPEVDYIWNLIDVQDSINTVNVADIIEKHGWLGVSRVGYSANLALWLVIQHAPLNVQEKYLDVLEESVSKGESEGWCLAYLYDRVQMRKGEKQKYGTQAVYNQSTGKYHIYRIEDPENVNNRRKAVGIEPIEEYVAKNGYVYDPSEWDK